jgi:hypothetical protein
MHHSGDEIQPPLSVGNMSAKQSNQPSFTNTAHSTGMVVTANNR